MNFRSPVLTAAALLLAAPAAAEPPPMAAPALTLGDAFEAALANNPLISALEETVPQARAMRDRAFAYITPQVGAGWQHRINDREISLDFGESFEPLGDAFGGLYGNIGLIYGKLFEAGVLGLDDCDDIAEVNDLTCDELLEAMQGEGGFGEPDVGVGGAFGDGPTVIQPKEQDFLSAQVTWPLNPRFATSLAAGNHNVKAADYTLENARTDLLLAVLQAYAGAYQAQEAVRIVQAGVELAEAHVRDTEVLLNAGVATRDFLLRAQLETEKARSQLREIKKQERAARRGLAMAMGSRKSINGPLGAVPTPALDPSASENDWVERAATVHPETAAAREQAAAARAMSIDAALAFLPQFAVTGQLNWSDQAAGFDNKQTSWFVGLGLNLPIWDGGQNVAAAREAASRKRQAEANVRAVEDRVASEVGNAYDTWRTAREAIPVSRLEVQLAEEAYRLVEARYKAGAARPLEVEDARTAVQQAELGLLRQVVSEQLAAAQLLADTGALSPAAFSP